jgi:hypothetical protein
VIVAARMQSKHQLEELLPLLRDKTPHVRYWACMRLAEISASTESLQAVSVLRADKGRWANRRPGLSRGLYTGSVSEAANFAIKAIELKKEEGPLVSRARSYEQEPAAMEAVRLLAFLPTKRSVEVLREIATAGPIRVGEAAAHSLGELVRRYCCTGTGRLAYEALLDVADSPRASSVVASTFVAVYAHEHKTAIGTEGTTRPATSAGRCGR